MSRPHAVSVPNENSRISQTPKKTLYSDVRDGRRTGLRLSSSPGSERWPSALAFLGREGGDSGTGRHPLCARSGPRKVQHRLSGPKARPVLGTLFRLCSLGSAQILKNCCWEPGTKIRHSSRLMFIGRGRLRPAVQNKTRPFHMCFAQSVCVH